MEYLTKLKRFIALDKPLLAVVITLLNGFIIIVTICGCNSYNLCYNDSNSPFCYNHYEYSVAKNPLFFFDHPQYAKNDGLSSERFGRYDWPTAQSPQDYINLGESITYREYQYSDQYISGDNVPRMRYHRRINGYRYGEKIR